MNEKPSVIKRSSDFVKTAKESAESYLRVLIGKDLRGEEERLASKKRRKQLLFFALFSSLSALFSLTALPLGITSLGFAFFVSASGRTALFSLVGLAFSLIWQENILVTLFVALLGLLMRILVARAAPTHRYFEESRRVRLALAVTLGFLESFALSALDGFSKPSLITLVATVFSAPVFAFLFTLITLPQKESAWREVGRLTVVFFLVYSLNTVGLFGLSIGTSLAFFLTLSIAVTGGSLRGVLMGTASGLALGGLCAPILAVAGLITGLSANLSLTYSVLGSAVLAIAMNLYLEGPATSLYFAIDILFAALIFLPLAKAKLIPEIRFFADEPSELPDMKYVEDLEKKFRQSRLKALSSAFEELSDVFLKLSERNRRPGSYEIEEVGGEVFSRYCKSCALYGICRQSDAAETDEAIRSLYKKVQSGNTAAASDLPEAFGKRCRHLDKIIRDINNAAADLVERAIRRDKTELFALDYEAMAELLSETAGESDEAFERDTALAKKAASALRSLGFSSLGYSAWGRRQKTVLASGVDITSLSMSGKEIAAALQTATGLAFSDPHFDFSGDFVTMTLSTRPLISLEYATASRAKEDGTVSGDATAIFEDSYTTPHILLCDGMGSGKAAAITARIATVFLEKMIAAGNSPRVVLKMLSNFLRSKSEECHSTCDLVAIDRYGGEVLFTKCGAAPSYLLHEGALITIDLRSLPIGITRDFAPAVSKLPIAPGDILLLASDGIAVKEDALTTLLASPAFSLQQKADTVLSTFSGGDDAAVILMEISA